MESSDGRLLWITAVAATFHQRLRNYLLSPSFPFCRGREGWGWEGEWSGGYFQGAGRGIWQVSRAVQFDQRRSCLLIESWPVFSALDPSMEELCTRQTEGF